MAKITMSGCEFYLNGTKIPFLNIDDLHGSNLGQELSREEVRRIMLTAIKKINTHNGDAKCQSLNQ